MLVKIIIIDESPAEGSIPNGTVLLAKDNINSWAIRREDNQEILDKLGCEPWMVSWIPKKCAEVFAPIHIIKKRLKLF